MNPNVKRPAGPVRKLRILVSAPPHANKPMSVWAIVSFPEADKPSVQMLCDLTGAPGWMVEIEGKAYVVDSVVNGKLLCKV